MKKKNLNFLLALLAALALVFAGACSDGSDADPDTETPTDDGTGIGNGSEGGGGDDDQNAGGGGNNNTDNTTNNNNNENNDDDEDTIATSDSLADKIKGTKWTFEGASEAGDQSSDDATLGTIVLEFDDSGNVTGTATWWIYDSSSTSNVAHAGSITGISYAVDDTDGDTINVTLGSATLPLKLDGTSYTTDANGNVTINITANSSELTVGTLSDATYTVACDGNAEACGATSKCEGVSAKTVDIFDSNNLKGESAVTQSKTFTCTDDGSGS